MWLVLLDKMPFGMSTSPEEFQRQLIQALEGLDGIMHIFDDTLVFNVGESQDEAVRNHDAKLRALFERCCTKGTNLNKDKLKLRLPEVAFMSHVISREGLKPDPAYVQGIQEMPDPVKKQNVKRLMRMVNSLQRFAPNLPKIPASLRDLLKEVNQFNWEPEV